jgi:hypothetical protein
MACREVQALPAHMAIAYDQASNSSGSGTGLSHTHTPVGTPKGVFVFIFSENGGQTHPASVTYGGVSFNKLQDVGAVSGRNWRVSCYFLGSGIPTGAQTVAATLGLSLSTNYLVCVTVTAAGNTQLAGIGSAGTSGGSGANASLSVTGPSGASYGVFGMIHDDSTVAGASEGSGQTMIYEVDLGGHCFYIERNTSPVGSGTNSMSFTSQSANWSGAMIAIEEAAIIYDQAVTATATMASSLVKGMSKTMVGTAATVPSMATVKTILQALTATAATVPSMLKSVSKELTVTIAATASTLAERVYLQALTATIEAAADIAKIPGKALTATAEMTASLEKTLELLLSITATTNITASMTKQMQSALTATAATVATVTKVPGKLLQATATTVASMTKQMQEALTATATIVATTDLVRLVTLTATTAVTASFITLMGKTLSATARIRASVSAPFWRPKYPVQGDTYSTRFSSHGDGADYEIKYPHE